MANARTHVGKRGRLDVSLISPKALWHSGWASADTDARMLVPRGTGRAHHHKIPFAFRRARWACLPQGIWSVAESYCPTACLDLDRPTSGRRPSRISDSATISSESPRTVALVLDCPRSIPHYWTKTDMVNRRTYCLPPPDRQGAETRQISLWCHVKESVLD